MTMTHRRFRISAAAALSFVGLLILLMGWRSDGVYQSPAVVIGGQ